MFEDLNIDGWTWHVGSCGSCKAQGVPVATNEYYTTCADCLRRVVRQLDEKLKIELKEEPI